MILNVDCDSSSFSAPLAPLAIRHLWSASGWPHGGDASPSSGLPLAGLPGRSSRRPPRLAGSGGQQPYPLQLVFRGFISLSVCKLKVKPLERPSGGWRRLRAGTGL